MPFNADKESSSKNFLKKCSELFTIPGSKSSQSNIDDKISIFSTSNGILGSFDSVFSRKGPSDTELSTPVLTSEIDLSNGFWKNNLFSHLGVPLLSESDAIPSSLAAIVLSI